MTTSFLFSVLIAQSTPWGMLSGRLIHWSCDDGSADKAWPETYVACVSHELVARVRGLLYLTYSI